MLKPGAVMGGRYQIVRSIGQGGMGEVYEAMQVQLARRVALKTIRASLASRPELLARFRREAESAAALGHPNLVQVTDFHAAPGEVPFLVMEMLDGGTLKEVLDREGRIDPARAAFIGLQLLSGLGAAHRAGIVHRDVKPGNVFLQSTTAVRDLVKVVDFGVAKLALEAEPDKPPMTQFGEVLGTLSYMAPEQGVSGAPVDARTDIFAVGATLFHALAGVRPFDVTEPGGARTPLEKVAPWVHRDLAAIVERALQKAPEARWPSADEMAAALQPFAGSGASAPAAAPSAPAGWNPAAIGRLEAPTGGSSYGSAAGSFEPSNIPGFVPPPADPSMFVPRDGTLMEHGARAPSQYTAPPAITPAPSAFASAYGGAPVVSGAAPPGAMPYVPRAPSAPPPMAPYGYPPGARAPQYVMIAPKAGKPWWLLIVAVVVLGAGIPYIMSFIAIRNATNPDTIATNVEREVLKQPKQPCPAGDACTKTKEEHGLTYQYCTRRVPQVTPYKPGEMVLAGADDRIALINSNQGNGRYEIRFLTGREPVTVNDEDIVGRLCRPGSPQNF